MECSTALLDHAADPNMEDIDGRTLSEWKEKEAVKEASQKLEGSRSSQKLEGSRSSQKLDGGRTRGNTDRKEVKGKERGFTPLHNAVAYG